jgi:hypothetical protein
LTPPSPKTKQLGPDGQTALTLAVHAEIKRLAGLPADPSTLNLALRTLAKWRSSLVANTVVKQSGHRVMNGPFAGMDYAVASAEGAKASRLLGCYEASLAPVFEQVIARPYGQIIDVGCAEGYYAVGLALRLPKARVLARDINPAAQALCRDLAALNGVEGRVDVGGQITAQEFDACLQERTFVLCDIEGAEDQLLDPLAAPGLAVADILVECHDVIRSGLTDRMAARFSATHRITRIDRVLAPQLLPDWMNSWSDMDRLMAMWEWRGGPTPWLWMEVK